MYMLYSPDIPVSAADCKVYTSAIGTAPFFAASSSLGRIQHLRILMQL